MAFLTAPLFLLLNKVFLVSEITILNTIMTNTLLFVYYFFRINIGLGIFNLLPIPPFDGSRIINVVLPPKLYFKVMKYERYIYWGVVIWLLLGQNVYSFLMSFSFVASNPILSGIALIFPLSMHISNATNTLANAIFNLWSLIPFLR